MRPPRNLMEMLHLAGCMASPGRFISKYGERSLPFFKLMKRSGPFKWALEATAAAFEDLKRYLTSPLAMVAPRPRERLLLCPAATPQPTNAALVVEREQQACAKRKPAESAPTGTNPVEASCESPQGSDDAPLRALL